MIRPALVLLLLAPSSCVLGERYADLTYPPERRVRISRPVEAASHVPPRIALGVFRDDRGEPEDSGKPEKIGELYNVVGWKTGELLTRADVVDWVRGALWHELEAAGYEVVDGPDYDSMLDVAGSVVRVFTVGEHDYDAEVVLELELARPNREPTRARYYGRATTELNLRVTGTTWGQSLSLALRDALIDVVADVKRLVPRRATIEAPSEAPSEAAPERD